MFFFKKNKKKFLVGDLEDPIGASAFFSLSSKVFGFLNAAKKKERKKEKNGKNAVASKSPHSFCFFKEAVNLPFP